MRGLFAQRRASAQKQAAIQQKVSDVSSPEVPKSQNGVRPAKAAVPSGNTTLLRTGTRCSPPRPSRIIASVMKPVPSQTITSPTSAHGAISLPTVTKPSHSVEVPTSTRSLRL